MSFFKQTNTDTDYFEQNSKIEYENQPIKNYSEELLSSVTSTSKQESGEYKFIYEPNCVVNCDKLGFIFRITSATHSDKWLSNEFIASQIKKFSIKQSSKNLSTVDIDYACEIQQRLTAYLMTSKSEAYDNLGVNSSLSNLHKKIDNGSAVTEIITQHKSAKSSYEENELERYIPLSVFAPYFTGIRKLDERYEIEIDLIKPDDDEFRFLIKPTADGPVISGQELHFVHNTVELDLVGKELLNKQPTSQKWAYTDFIFDSIHCKAGSGTFDKYLTSHYKNIKAIHILSTESITYANAVLPFYAGIGQDFKIKSYRLNIGNKMIQSNDDLIYSDNTLVSIEPYKNFIMCCDPSVSAFDKFLDRFEYSRTPILSIPVTNFLPDMDREKLMTEPQTVKIKLSYQCTEAHDVHVVIETIKVAEFDQATGSFNLDLI